jgi:ArsR family transcriptional regulator, arsenate/arsenite/antimonite-responsive transcriptional repressor
MAGVARSAALATRGERCSTVTAAPLDDVEAAELAAGFHALADPVRLKLLSLLASADGGEVCVCELVDQVDRSQATVSHHLRILTNAGLAVGDRRGKWVWYSVVPERLHALHDALAVGN